MQHATFMSDFHFFLNILIFISFTFFGLFSSALFCFLTEMINFQIEEKKYINCQNILKISVFF